MTNLTITEIRKEIEELEHAMELIGNKQKTRALEARVRKLRELEQSLSTVR